ncbi:hypothetical protein BT63DRAFT_484528 [Microthyrium microscopicum]|uniref:DUF2418 domain-containing protein n=1 Tax=Microthyrium microscopicum TaxID=703497 RepID=A0A6A6TUT4_9PEZI|nr:hypothetical protein BT63DRAFT_484528 [Microthyrium microscopicum]
MPPQPTRHVRRAPLAQRLNAWLHPSEVALWLSEELASQDWEQFNKTWSNTIGISLNLLLIFARVNSTLKSHGDDIFVDYSRSTGAYFSGLCTLIVWVLTTFSLVNAFFAYQSSKPYRLFHVNINAPPATPSARRVKVTSSPSLATPFRFLADLATPSAQSRAHPDDNDDVWEILAWDPPSVCLRLFVLFSPGHVGITWLFLPYSQLDPRPSVTVIQTIALCALLSLQGYVLQTKFEQKSKDAAVITQQVSKEYDTKFVQPNAHKRPVRDVGIQFPHPGPVWDQDKREWGAVAEVVSGSPYVSPRGFRTAPNTAYASHYDPQNLGAQDSQRSRPLVTPSAQSYGFPSSAAPSGPADQSSPIRHAPPLQSNRPQYASTGSGDGGSLGVYTHAASPLRKAASSNILRHNPGTDGRKREGSPLKRASTPAAGLHQRLVNARDDKPGSRRDTGYY